MLILWYFAHYFFSTLSITWVFCILIVFYFCYYVGVFAHFVFYFYYYVGVLRTNCFLLSLLRWCFAHYLFLTFTITLVFCALFVFYSHQYVGFCALFVFYFYYYVGVLRTICFLLLLLRWCVAHHLFFYLH